jgi:DTW domain-containing protein YfiP
MKVTKAALNEAEKKVNEFILPLIPKPVKFTKENSVTFKLRTNPTENGSPTYEKAILVLDGSESVRDAIAWYQDLEVIQPRFQKDDPRSSHQRCSGNGLHHGLHRVSS